MMTILFPTIHPVNTEEVKAGVIKLETLMHVSTQ